MVLLPASAGTTVLYGSAVILLNTLKDEASWWAHQVSIALDIPFDAVLALLCAGLIGPRGDRDAQLAEVARFAAERQERHIFEKLVEAARRVRERSEVGAACGPALTLAALFEGKNPEVLRCISWDVLSTGRDIIAGGGPLDQVGEGPAELYYLSQPCLLTQCTAFLSHSWHDDGEQKWLALEAWCADYGDAFGCLPHLWLDKVCIEQSNIQADLQCLPIFIAGCNTLLIVCGTTYTARLWCCVELFVHDSMHMEDESRDAPTVITIGANDDEHERVHTSWRNFDAAACQCFDARDKTRIISVIERHPDGIDGFNRHMRTLATEVFGRSYQSGKQSQRSEPSGFRPSGISSGTDTMASTDRRVAPGAPPQQLGAEFTGLVDVIPGSVPFEPRQ